MTQPKHSQIIVAGAYLLLAMAIYVLLMQEFRLDDSFITYRYAQNLAAGNGLIYNIGENILSTTAPLYAIVLALLSLLVADFHILGGIFGTVCIAAGASLLFGLLKKHPLWIRGWAGLAYVLATPLWLALGMETPLWLALVLLAVTLADNRNWLFAGLCMGLAMLSRPDAVLPGLLLGFTVIGFAINQRGTTGRWWRPVFAYGLAAAIPVMLFYGWAWMTYGSPFPATLSAKSAQAVVGVTGFATGTQFPEGLQLVLDSLLQQSPLYVVLAVLILIGGFFVGRSRLRPYLFSPAAMLVVLWGILHFVAYILLGTAPYRWYYLPVLPGAILLAAYGLSILSQRLSSRIAMLLAVIPILAAISSFIFIQGCFADGCAPGAAVPTVDWKAYRETGQWLANNTPDNALVGVSEVGQVGFYAERRMTDYLGLLQPEVAQMLKRDDLYSWLVGYAPDYLVFQRDRGQTGLRLYTTYIQEDPWFNAAYREIISFDDLRYHAAPISIFERIIEKTPVIAHDASLTFDTMLLENYAAETNLQPGDSLRIRLDWEVLNAAALPERLQITLEIGETDIKSDSGYPTSAWEGRFSTWHSIILPDTLTGDDYPLRLTLWSPGRAALTEIIGTVIINS
ncbi:MAG: hypothetical protein ACPG7F_12705 [Aggregatilineales bacterium]